MTVGFLASKLQLSDDYVPINDPFFWKNFVGLLLDMTIESQSLKSTWAESTRRRFQLAMASWSRSTSSQEAAWVWISWASCRYIKSDSWAWALDSSVKSFESIFVWTLDLASESSRSIPSWISLMKLGLNLMLLAWVCPIRGARGGGDTYMFLGICGLLLWPFGRYFVQALHYVDKTGTLSSTKCC